MGLDSSSLPPGGLHPPADDGGLAEGQFVPAAYHSSNDEAPAPPPHHARRRPTLDDLPSPTPSSESEGTISDDSNLIFRTQLPPKRAVVAAPLDGGWAATCKRCWAGGKPAPAPLNAQSSHSSNVSSGSAHAVVVHQPPPPLVAEQAQHLRLHLHQPATSPSPPPARQLPQPQQPVAPQQHPRREYTCKECGRSFPTNQALGGHAAGHRNRQREAEAAAAACMVAEGEDGAAFLAVLPRARGGREEAPHECRKCGKVFATGVALGGHMRVHYTGPPIVPARKTRKRRLTLLPVGEDVAVAAPPPPPGLSLALSIKTEHEAASTLAPAGGVRVVRLFGIDISPQVQAPSSEQQCFGKAEDFSSPGGQQ